MTRTLVSYKSYSFKEKDPIIDQLRTLMNDENLDIETVCRDSGVKETTLMAWFYGMTRRPQFATVKAVALAMGYDMDPHRKQENVVKLRRKRA